MDLKFWLTFTGSLLIIGGALAILFLMWYYWRRRADLHRHAWVFLFAGAGIAGRLIWALLAVSSFYPADVFQAGGIFLTGIMLAFLAGAMGLVLPKLLKIPTEQQLLDANNLYRTSSEASLEGVIHTRTGRIVWANQNACEMYGYTLAELQHIATIKLVYPEDWETVSQNLREGKTDKYRCRGLNATGDTLYLEVRGRNTVNKDGPLRITAIKDLTQETLLAKKLTEDLEHAWVKVDTQDTIARILTHMGGIKKEENGAGR